MTEEEKKEKKSTELWFARYHICAREKLLQETQVKDRKDRKKLKNETTWAQIWLIL